MFEDSILTLIYFLEKQGYISLELKPIKRFGVESKTIIVKKLKDGSDLPEFAKSFFQSLGKEEELVEWIRNFAKKVSRFSNPAPEIGKKMEKEAEDFRVEKVNKFLIFKFKEKVWDKGKIEDLSKKELEKVKLIWEEGKRRPWWEIARKWLKAALTSIRTRNIRRQWERLE